MGALQKIRSKSTLLVGVIAVGLLAFVVPWGEITQFLNVAKDKAFVVNGEVVKTGEYSQRIGQVENMAKAGGQQLSEEQTAQIREEVFQTMVTEILLQDQSDKLGLSVTNAELNDLVYGAKLSPVLYELFGNPQTGQINRDEINRILKDLNQPLSSDPNIRAQQQMDRSQWSYIENRMRFGRLEEKYAGLIASSVLVNDIEAKSYFNDSKDVANIAYVVSDYDNIEDASIEVSDAELEGLYNLKKENFFSKYPSRSISYFVKNVLPSETDYSSTEQEMMEAKKELETANNPAMVVNQYSTSQYVDAFFAVRSLPTELKTFVQRASVGDVHGPTRGDKMYTMYQYVASSIAPDSISIQTLPVQSFDPTQATIIADSLMTVLKQGKSFMALAQEMFPNVPEVGKGEWVNEAMLSQAGIADKCFKAAKGEVIAINIGGMTTLVKIEDKTAPIAKAKVAVINMPVIVSDKTNNTIDNEINTFLSENKDVAEFEKASLNSGFNVVTDAVIFPNQATIEDIPSTRDVIRWAFNESKEGEIKKFETRDARIVAVVTSESKEGYLPVTNKEVKTTLTAEIIQNKKADKIIGDLKSKENSSLANLAESLDSKVDTAKFVTFQTNNITGVGYEPAFNVLSKIGEVNTATAEAVKGNAGVYVLNLTSKTEEAREYNAEMVKNMLYSNYSQMLSYSASYMLVNKMDVEDNRIKFY